LVCEQILKEEDDLVPVSTSGFHEWEFRRWVEPRYDDLVPEVPHGDARPPQPADAPGRHTVEVAHLLPLREGVQLRRRHDESLGDSEPFEAKLVGPGRRGWVPRLLSEARKGVARQ